MTTLIDLSSESEETESDGKVTDNGSEQETESNSNITDNCSEEDV